MKEAKKIMGIENKIYCQKIIPIAEFMLLKRLKFE